MNKKEELTDILRKVEWGQLDSTVAFDRILRLFSVSGSLPTEKEGEEHANSIISNGACDNEDELNIYRNGIEFGWKACLDRIKSNDR